MLFTELDLHEEVIGGIDAAGFEECTEVQALAIPPGMQGRDLMVQSQTGSGKTAAFLLPVFHRYLTGETGAEWQTLILAPTRELADQIYQEARLLGSKTQLRFAVCYGGVGYGRQEEDLAAKPHVIIGTPGRIMDHAKSNRIDFASVGVLVIDEADRMFDMGFYPDVRWMVQRMPGSEKRQTLLFSATLGTKVMDLAWEYMREPVDIKVDAEKITVDTIQQTVFHVGKNEKMALLLGLLNREKPNSCIIFTNTKRGAEQVCQRLNRNGYTAEYIMGDLPQSKRSAIIKRVKRGDLPVLVATDVAARGLHVNDLEMVVNYDVPEDAENYVHRIGRTARAGKTGRAYMLACERFVYGLPSIEEYIQQKIPVEPVVSGLLFKDTGGSNKDAGRNNNENRNRKHGSSRDSRPPAHGKRRNVSVSVESESVEKKPKPDRPKTVSKKNLKQKGEVAKNPSKYSTPQERLEYYRSKYGEDFAFKEETVVEKKKKQKLSIWQRLFTKKK